LQDALLGQFLGLLRVHLQNGLVDRGQVLDDLIDLALRLRKYAVFVVLTDIALEQVEQFGDEDLNEKQTWQL